MPLKASLLDREIWLNAYYNDLVTYAAAALAAIPGSDLPAPLILSRSRQALDGGNHRVYDFKRWMGTSNTATQVRDVTQFGVVADGATDDSAGINAAIADLPASGGIILFPPTNASYRIASPATVSSKTNVTLMGFGFSSLITVSAAITAIDILGGSTGIQVRDLGITNVGSGTIGISIGGSALHCVVNDCRISGFTEADVFVKNSCGYIWLELLTLFGSGDGIKLGDVTRSNDVFVHACKMNGCMYGVDSLYMPYRTNISSCSIRGSLTNGINVQADANNPDPMESSIYGNLVADSVSTGLNLYAGNSTGTPRVFRDLAVAGNVVSGSGRVPYRQSGCLMMGHDSTSFKGISFSGNVFSGSGENGLKIGDLTGASATSNCSVSGNAFYNNGSTGLLTDAGLSVGV